MKCEIIKDLLPSYIDELTSKESNTEIEKHLENCSSCQNVLNQMNTEIDAEMIQCNKEKIKPLKRLNKRVLKSVLISIGGCVLLFTLYLYIFGFGWKVKSEDLNITYRAENDIIQFYFELTNGRVLNAWNEINGASSQTISFTESLHSVLDDRGENPNKFSYGVHYKNSEGKIQTFSDDNVVIFEFKDKTETIKLKDIAKELELQ